ncbi:thioredoxin-dependent thiol peroxidase [Pararhodobacter zhoushanensis]|uniref:thioredoxin-dependent peroxiredoxin n=1 Tax=Pararhodobacter zhoushanensis TaxID=2479545 RepID=A0ABT3H0L2_9RHOB|nr:thioredoxin-dependent thiol peroxidase [Pararhodobacter zhoushanensis]MCW1933318.1 thioredoxin-dependent thiol peroxidase [Pararhodobacter zhoushanensis]
MIIGETAPDFTAPTQNGEDLTLSDLRGQPVVLYFYPKDDTPGCTQEAKDFTELGHQFEAAGAKVIGISKDTVAKHEKFALKYDLGVTLVSDAEGEICEQYGVWGEKKNYGKTYMGITRATFLIDGEGRLAREWPKVKVAGHAEEVLDAVKEMVSPA